MAFLLGCGTPIAVEDIHQAAADRAQQQAAARSADQLTLAHELPGTPPDVVAAWVTLLAEGGPIAAQEGCLLFSAPAAAQFAAAHDAPSCMAAMLRLQAQVNDPSTYSSGLTVPQTAWVQLGTTATVNGCAVTWSALFTDTSVTAPGPLPGLLGLTQLDGSGWQITSYQPC
jgi:hypothetical protein